MIRRIVKREYGEEKEFFFQESTRKRYRRIYGGFAWPYIEKPGFAVVVGEALEKDSITKAHNLVVLAEVEEHKAGDLLRRCQELDEQYMVQGWFGDTFNKPMKAFFYHFKKEPGNDFSFRTAPHADDPRGLSYYIQMLVECVEPNRKVLKIGEESKLPSYLMQVNPEDTLKTPGEQPPIAALGYAVVKLRTTSPPESRRPQREYSPLAM